MDSDITGALDRIARDLGDARDIDDVLGCITEATRISLHEVDHVGISITHRRRRFETRVWTDDLVIDLDKVQNELGEGPCIDSVDPLLDLDIVRVDTIAREQRWPTYVPHAVRAGLRSQLALRLHSGKTVLGGLNLYSTSADAISAESEALARLFATHAVLALGRVVREQDLNDALETRTVIGQATGIVMERYRLDPDRAFEYLVRVSQANNVKLRDVAAELVGGGAALAGVAAGGTQAPG